MKKIKISKRAALYTAAAFFIPLLIMLCCLYFIGAAPFGDSTLTFRDAKGQYIDFLSYMTTVFSGENDIFYSFSKSIGSNFLSLAAYYLFSPFNILFTLASRSNMPMMFDLVVILKFACCGLVFYCCSAKLYGNRAVLLAFSTVYALNGYNIINSCNIMWLDAVIILPLVCLGIILIWTEEKYVLYIISLFVALITSYYTGFMLCVFSVLFCITMFFVNEGTELKQKIITFSKYMLSSVIAGFSSAFIWLPAIMAVHNYRSGFEDNPFIFEINFGIASFASKLFSGAANAEQVGGTLPNIFCSLSVVFLVVLFVLNSNIKLKNRIAAVALLGVLFLSMYVDALNNIWHGFSSPNGFNFRYAFIFPFILISIAQYQWVHGGKTTKLQTAISALVMLAVIILVKISHFEYISSLGMAISVFSFATVFLLNIPKKITEKITVLILIVVCSLDMYANAFISLDTLTENLGNIDIKSHRESTAVNEELMSYVIKQDDGFYRTEKLLLRSHNDAMFYNYNGITHFSSTDSGDTLRFLGKMGLRDNDIWAFFNTGTTNEAEALLGIKYIIGGADITKYKNYEIIRAGENNVYENKNVLPIAFISDKDIKNVSADKADYFSLHNDIWTGITGKDQKILIPENNYKITLNNLTQGMDEEGNTVYTCIDDSLTSSVIYDIEISHELPLYFYFTSPLVQVANVYINGVDDGQYFWLYRWDMADAGIYKPSEKVRIELVLREHTLVVTAPYFYYEDLDNLQTVTDEIKSKPSEIRKIKSSYLKGSFTALEESVLMFSIPYDEGWTLKIDGEKTEVYKVLDALMAADINAGEHSFELRYFPPGIRAGIYLSCIAFAVSIAWYLTEKKKHK